MTHFGDYKPNRDSNPRSLFRFSEGIPALTYPEWSSLPSWRRRRRAPWAAAGRASAWWRAAGAEGPSSSRSLSWWGRGAASTLPSSTCSSQSWNITSESVHCMQLCFHRACNVMSLVSGTTLLLYYSLSFFKGLMMIDFSNRIPPCIFTFTTNMNEWHVHTTKISWSFMWVNY